LGVGNSSQQRSIATVPNASSTGGCLDDALRSAEHARGLGDVPFDLMRVTWSGGLRPPDQSDRPSPILGYDSRYSFTNTVLSGQLFLEIGRAHV